MTFGFGEGLAREMAVTMPQGMTSASLRPADLDSQKAYRVEAKQESSIGLVSPKAQEPQRLPSDYLERQARPQQHGFSSTQKVFPSIRAGHSMFVSGSLARDDYPDSEIHSAGIKSIRTQGANSSGSRKIGGFARRQHSKKMIAVNSGKKLSGVDSFRNIQPIENNQIGKHHSSRAALEDSLGKTGTEGAKSGEEIEDQLNKLNKHDREYRVHSTPKDNSQQNITYSLQEPDEVANLPPPVESKAIKTPGVENIIQKMTSLKAEIIKMDLPSVNATEEQAPSLADPFSGAIETQTAPDLNPNLRLKIRRSRKSFQNQVYLDGSEDQLKSQISNATEKAKQKKMQETTRLYELKKEQIKANLLQIEMLEQEMEQVEMEMREEEALTEKEVKTRNIKINRMEVNEEGRAQTGATDLNKVRGDRASIHPAKGGMVNASVQLNPAGHPGGMASPAPGNPLLMQDQDSPLRQIDQGVDPRSRDVELDAKARDMATDPMICEKATDPKMKDQSNDAWKRDGIMQTSNQSRIPVSAQRESRIHGLTIKTQKSGRSAKVDNSGSIKLSPDPMKAQHIMKTNNGAT